MYHFDPRLGWIICCFASAGCAAVLCTVVWARFLQVPALLTLREMRTVHNDLKMPLVAICPTAETVADMFATHFKVDAKTAKRLPAIFGHILRRKNITSDKLIVMEKVLRGVNMTFTELLYHIVPDCDIILLKCFWQNQQIPCNRLFHKHLTQWGVCCIAAPNNFRMPPTIISRLETIRYLSVSMQCSQKPTWYNCEFFTKYDVEEWFQPVPLRPGYVYQAYLTSYSVIDSDPEKLMDGTCAANQFYSRSRCLLKCMEQRCGCSDVVRITDPDELNVLPTCPIQKLTCLRYYKRDKTPCNCLPTCKKVTTSLALESSRMNALNYTLNKLYSDVNASLGSVLNIRLRISGSRIFSVDPTETWITLLSSLGGVFNMFLGVGFFSALEVLFLIIFRIPTAIQKSMEIGNPNIIK